LNVNFSVSLRAESGFCLLSLGEPNVSGTMEHDYPSLGTQTGRNLHQIGQIKKTSLPPELVERFACILCRV